MSSYREAMAGHCDAEGKTPLEYAGENGHYRVMGLLIDHGIDVNAKDNVGNTPFRTAIIRKNLLC